jgi:hypothetical protein
MTSPGPALASPKYKDNPRPSDQNQDYDTIGYSYDITIQNGYKKSYKMQKYKIQRCKIQKHSDIKTDIVSSHIANTGSARGLPSKTRWNADKSPPFTGRETNERIPGHIAVAGHFLVT